MKTLIFGTKNQAKIDQIRGALKGLNITVCGLSGDIPEVIEDGRTAGENARKKAVAYSYHCSQTVLSMDVALYFDHLEEDAQPGIHVRRINNKDTRPTDEELLEYYSRMIAGKGGSVTGYWEFALCIAKPDGKLHETTIKSPRVFTDKISSKMVKGYPLESIQIDPDSDKFISEMTKKEQADFWQQKIGRPLAEFIWKYI